MWENMKMVNRLGLVFGIIILLFGGANLLTVNRMNTVANLTDNLYRHPFTVSTSVLRANSSIIAIHRSMKDVALAKNESQMQAAIHAVNQAEKKVYEDFTLIDEWFLGDKKLIAAALQGFREWKSIRDEVIALMRSGEETKAAAITIERGAKHVALLNQNMKALEDFAMNKAVEFHSNAIQTKNQVKQLGERVYRKIKYLHEGRSDTA